MNSSRRFFPESRPLRGISYFLLAGLLSIGLGRQAHALDIFWRNPAGGAFSSTGSWFGGLVPSNTDVANFSVNATPPPFLPPPYTVTFSANVTNQALEIHDDLVTFDLNTRTYATTTAAGVAVGTVAGRTGSLTVTDGTINVTAGLATPTINVGAVATGRGTLVVGSAGRITGSANLNVGHLHTGALAVTSGGVISIGTNTSTIIGNNAGVAGTATITGIGSSLTTNGLTVGNSGNGTLNLDILGMLQVNANSVMGNNAGSTATANVTNASQWLTTGNLTIGNSGQGTLNISANGLVRNVNGSVGVGSGGSGTVTVEGGNSLWDNTGSLKIGEGGAGTLSVTNGGRVESEDVFLGFTDGGTGSINVADANSELIHSLMRIGRTGPGTLLITAGARVAGTSGSLGSGTGGGSGTATVTGPVSSWTLAGNLDVGVSGNGSGTLSVTGGGLVQSIGGSVGGGNSGSEANVNGPNSQWVNTGDLNIGASHEGTLNITDGGTVTSVNAMLAENGAGIGTVVVSGPNSQWLSSGAVTVGRFGHGTLNIVGGGYVETKDGLIAQSDSIGTVVVDGPNSRWTTLGFPIVVGNSGTATMDITGGGAVSSGDAFIARSRATCIVTVAGANSLWAINGRLSIGGNVNTNINGGPGTLRIQPGGTVNVTQRTHLWDDDSLFLEGGTLSTTEIQMEGPFGNRFFWTSGTLHVGIYDGSLVVPNGGVLAPGNSAGTTLIQGNYVQTGGGALEIEIGGLVEGSQHDHVDVMGNTALDGNLQLSMLNDFVPSAANTFTILQTTGIVTGAFTNIANGQRLTTSNGLGSFLVHYGAGSAFNPDHIVLSAFQPGFAADFDEDGDVDGADLTRWRTNFGTGTTHMTGDADGDGDADGGDFLTWQRQLGSPPPAAGAAAAVPEPASLSISVTLSALALVRFRRA